MSEETDAPQGGAEGENTPSVVDDAAPAVNADDTAAQDTGTDETGQADETGDSPKRKPWWEKRFDELTAKRYEAERDAAYWRGKAESAKTVDTPQADAPKKPSLEQFDYDEAAYEAALDRFYEERAEKAVERSLEKRTAAQQHQSEIEQAQRRLAEGASKHSGFEAAVSDIPVTDAVRDLLVNDDAAADILYELATNGDVAQFASLSPYRQAIELGKIAARISSPASTPSRNIPPPPPQTVSGLSAGLHKAPEEMSMAEYSKAREAGQI